MAVVFVLGVAQDGGHPQAGCIKPCCAASWKQGGHCVSCLGIKTEGKVFLLDASPDLPCQLHRMGAPLAGIVLTHAHAGHYTGLWHLGREAMNTNELPVFVMPKMKQFLLDNQPYRALVNNKNIVFVDLIPGVGQRLTNEVQVVPHLVEHRGPWSETIGIEVKTGSGRLLYVPDIDHFRTVPLAKWLADYDAVLLDGTFYSDHEVARDMGVIPHPFVTHTLSLLESTSEELRKKLFFIHLNHSNPLLDESSEASAHLRRWGAQVAREGQQFSL